MHWFMAVCASWCSANGHSLSASLTQIIISVLMLAVQLRSLGYTGRGAGAASGGSREEALGLAFAAPPCR